MKRYWSYLKYLIKHKFWVFYAAKKFKLDVSTWRLLVHDMSKFLPGEFVSYAKAFYDINGNFDYVESNWFMKNWNYHQKRNKHHWQYWVLILDRGDIVTIKIPKKYLTEMIADWLGAGKTITGKWDIANWFEKNKDIIIMENTSKQMIESIIKYLDYSG